MSKTIAIALIISTFLLATPPVTSGTETVQIATGVSVILDFGNGTVLTFEEITADTVYNATREVTSVEADWYGDLVFVTSIAGVANDPSRGLWWQYWVDGILGPVAANKYNLENGNVVEWRLSPQNTTTKTTPMTESETDSSLVIGTTMTAALGIGFLIVLSIRRRTL
ncbi:MAG: DUF4430 domain-containing protein [Candidatus Thorarchaeota archaeon]|nr:DUF4430 domain-containing protein [Candidatus Thorarchaeota archaeon]